MPMQATQATQPAPGRGRPVRGALTILAMFALGGAVLWGLYRAPRATSPRSPDVRWGVPARTLRVVAVDCGWTASGTVGTTPGDIVPDLARLEPDLVLLRAMRSEDAVAYAEGLGMQRSFHPRLYQALGTRPRGPVGCLVLSKHPVFDAVPLLSQGPDRTCFGVRATSVVDGVRFWVGTGRATPGSDAAFQGAWREAGSPPVISTFDPVEAGLNTGGRWDVKNSGTVEVRGVKVGLWADLVPANTPQDNL